MHRRLFLNSLLAFVTAFVATTVIHEMGHYLAYLAIGADPMLFHNRVEASGSGLSMGREVFAALAGPAISLLQGLALLPLASRSKSTGPWALVLVWMALMGFLNAFGYVMVTPMSRAGDTGAAAALLGVPGWIQWSLVPVALLGLLGVALRSGPLFGRFSSSNKDVPFLVVLPIMLGGLINAALAFPVTAALSVIYPITSPYVLMAGYPRILRALADHPSDCAERLSWGFLATCAAAIILNRLLTAGAI